LRLMRRLRPLAAMVRPSGSSCSGLVVVVAGVSALVAGRLGLSLTFCDGGPVSANSVGMAAPRHDCYRARGRPRRPGAATAPARAARAALSAVMRAGRKTSGQASVREPEQAGGMLWNNAYGLLKVREDALRRFVDDSEKERRDGLMSKELLVPQRMADLVPGLGASVAGAALAWDEATLPLGYGRLQFEGPTEAVARAKAIVRDRLYDPKGKQAVKLSEDSKLRLLELASRLQEKRVLPTVDADGYDSKADFLEVVEQRLGMQELVRVLLPQQAQGPGFLEFALGFSRKLDAAVVSCSSRAFVLYRPSAAGRIDVARLPRPSMAMR